MASIAIAPSLDKLGSARNNAVTSASVSAFCFFPVLKKSSALMPDQAHRAERLSTSGFRPWDIRVRVEAGTFACSATFFHVRPLAVRAASSAEKNRSPSNLGDNCSLLSCNLIPKAQYDERLQYRNQNPHQQSMRSLRNNSMSKGKGGGHYRSAISGRYVTTAHGQRSPHTTVREASGPSGSVNGATRSAITGQFVRGGNPSTTTREK